jgi:S-adenosylmethionine:tRNA ribosyltransferase-isomerase
MKLNIPNISLSNYTYELPRERIAQYPLNQRDQSRLLVYRQGQITHQRFFQLPDLLSPSSMLFFNNTKVINARLFFKRASGATIQIFLLEPTAPFPVQLALQSTQTCVWESMIGNRKKWKKDETLRLKLPESGDTLEASWEDYEQSLVRFRWTDTERTFAQIIDEVGRIPLPPYIEREVTEADLLQYQTIYSKEKGAVAAPTAGLHFTDVVFENLAKQNIHTDFVTLHVGAGTFLPIKEEKIQDHDMHSEQIIVSETNLQHLLDQQGRIIAVGTTSMRVLESLYWLGVGVLQKDLPIEHFKVPKLYPYQYDPKELPSYKEVFSKLLEEMKAKNITVISGKTEIFIFPGYDFKVCNGLITNFHMPKSTLILLIAAFVGEDWRKIYQEALGNDYRFLSYGDSSILLPDG